MTDPQPTSGIGEVDLDVVQDEILRFVAWHGSATFDEIATGTGRDEDAVAEAIDRLLDRRRLDANSNGFFVKSHLPTRRGLDPTRRRSANSPPSGGDAGRSEPRQRASRRATKDGWIDSPLHRDRVLQVSLLLSLLLGAFFTFEFYGGADIDFMMAASRSGQNQFLLGFLIDMTFRIVAYFVILSVVLLGIRAALRGFRSSQGSRI